MSSRSWRHPLSSVELCDEVTMSIDGGGLPGADDAGALALLDQRQPRGGRPGGEGIAVVHWPLLHAGGIRIVGDAGAFQRVRRDGLSIQAVLGTKIGSRPCRLDLPIDDLDRLVEPQR